MSCYLITLTFDNPDCRLQGERMAYAGWEGLHWLFFFYYLYKASWGFNVNHNLINTGLRAMAAIDNSLVSSRHCERRHVCATERACNLLRRLHCANVSACTHRPFSTVCNYTWQTSARCACFRCHGWFAEMSNFLRCLSALQEEVNATEKTRR